MNLVLMSLGPHIFYVPAPGLDTPGFETLSRDSSFSVPSQARLSRDPAMQFTGPGEEVVTIEGRLFPHHFGGLATLEALRLSGRAGKPLDLIRFQPLEQTFQGDVLGKYLIRRLRQQHQKIGVTGFAHKIDFTLELVAYGDDAGTVPDFAFLEA